MVTYTELKELFDSKGCVMLDTLEEFNESIQNGITYKNSRVCFKTRYIATCGHEHKVFHKKIKHDNGLMCPTCSIVQRRILQKAKTNVVDDGQASSHLCEDNCVEYITRKIEKDIDVFKTREGCLADFIIRPKGMDEDKWMMVQMKSTEMPSDSYRFAMKNEDDKYEKCIIICLCWSDKRMWVFENKDVTGKLKIAIGLHKSQKYDSFQMKKADLGTKLLDFYKTMETFTMDKLDTPISNNQVKEKEFAQLRETKCNFLKFDIPTKSQLCYDFTVNGKKIQEKVGKSTAPSVSFSISRRNGNIDKVSQRKAYCIGENDFYWLNFPDKQTFFVFPENVLKQHGHISAAGVIIKETKLTINPAKLHLPTHDWMNEYMFNYDKIDKDHLLALLNN